MSDRVNSDTSSDSSEESFYDPELASDSEDFSEGVRLFTPDFLSP